MSHILSRVGGGGGGASTGSTPPQIPFQPKRRPKSGNALKLTAGFVGVMLVGSWTVSYFMNSRQSKRGTTMRDAAYAATSLDESQQREEYIKKTAEEEIQKMVKLGQELPDDYEMVRIQRPGELKPGELPQRAQVIINAPNLTGHKDR